MSGAVVGGEHSPVGQSEVDREGGQGGVALGGGAQGGAGVVAGRQACHWQPCPCHRQAERAGVVWVGVAGEAEGAVDGGEGGELAHGALAA